MNNFDRAFDIVMKEEGGYVNDPNDPGGETNYGISKRQYPTEDIKNMTPERAKEIYRVDYWNAVSGDELPWPLCLYVFDSAVNQGVGPATKMLQRALDTVQDGLLGRTTIRLAKASRARHAHRFMAYRTQRYQSTRNYDRYGEGWLIRLFSVVHKAG